MTLDRKNHYTWGSSVVKSDDGKFHLYACQWQIKHGFHNWHTESTVVHFESAKPQGPWTYKDEVVSARPGGNKPGVWNAFTAHNPEVKRIDGKYVLCYISYPKKGAIPEARIGMKIADKPEGPWKDINGGKWVMEIATVPGTPSFKSRRGTDNPSLVKYQEKYYLFFMYNPGPADNTSLGVAVADKLEGPYVEQAIPVFAAPKGKKVEDLCVYLGDDSIHAVMCDNFGIMAANGGMHMQMDKELFAKNGTVQMKPHSVAYRTRPTMFPTFDFSQGKNVYGGVKYERPKVLCLNGKPSYLYLPSGFNARGDNWTRLHLFKIHLGKSPRKISKKLLPGTLPENANLGENLALAAKATASSAWKNQSSYAAKAAIDGKLDSRWAAAAKVASIEIILPQATKLNAILIHEYKKRIQSYTLEAFIEGNWVQIQAGKSISKKPLKFKAIKTTRIRLQIQKSTEPPSLWEIELYNQK